MRRRRRGRSSSSSSSSATEEGASYSECRTVSSGKESISRGIRGKNYARAASQSGTSREPQFSKYPNWRTVAFSHLRRRCQASGVPVLCPAGPHLAGRAEIVRARPSAAHRDRPRQYRPHYPDPPLRTGRGEGAPRSPCAYDRSGTWIVHGPVRSKLSINTLEA